MEDINNNVLNTSTSPSPQMTLEWRKSGMRMAP